MEVSKEPVPVTYSSGNMGNSQIESDVIVPTKEDENNIMNGLQAMVVQHLRSR